MPAKQTIDIQCENSKTTNSDLIVLLSKSMGVLLLISNIATVCIGWNLTVVKRPFLHLQFVKLPLPVHNCGVLFSCQLQNFFIQRSHKYSIISNFLLVQFGSWKQGRKTSIIDSEKNQQTLQRPSAENHMYCLTRIPFKVLQEILVWEDMRWIHEMSDLLGRKNR